MKIISWNVNGINSCVRKGLFDFMKREGASVYCFQELKSSKETINEELKSIKGYTPYFFFAEKKGYSGTACYTNKEPLSITKGIGIKEFDKEGRVLTLEFKDFFLINAYFPHSSRDLSRLDYKLRFNKAFEKYASKFRKNVVIASDFNVAHKPKDLANPVSNKKNAGFRPEEREWFAHFLNTGFVDSFRLFNQEGGNYTYWSFMHNARERNIGWRVDYFLVNKDYKDQVKSSEILSNVKGSDHCPIKLVIKE